MLDIQTFVKTFSYIGIFAIVFAESGLLVGIFLPGDSLLFIAGFLASQGLLNPVILIAVVIVAAVVGDNVGYHIGRKYGPRVFKRPESRFLSQDMIRRAEGFYAVHGGKTIILSRFTPFVRTLAPMLAGVGGMDYKRFFTYNLIGGVLWGAGVTLLGFFLGSAIPDIDHYLLPAIAVIVAISLAPSAWHLWRKRRKKA